MIVTHLTPPYYAVIFTTLLSTSESGYIETSKRMQDLAAKQNGFLGIESSRDDLGITVSYWKNKEAILEWKNNLEHLQARKKGREEWYQQYQLRICKVEREYGFKK